HPPAGKTEGFSDLESPFYYTAKNLQELLTCQTQSGALTPICIKYGTLTGIGVWDVCTDDGYLAFLTTTRGSPLIRRRGSPGFVSSDRLLPADERGAPGTGSLK
ncbi:hypothetical protein ABVT39_019742, partial [Epinephelus coioides]